MGAFGAGLMERNSNMQKTLKSKTTKKKKSKRGNRALGTVDFVRIFARIHPNHHSKIMKEAGQNPSECLRTALNKLYGEV